MWHHHPILFQVLVAPLPIQLSNNVLGKAVVSSPSPWSLHHLPPPSLQESRGSSWLRSLAPAVVAIWGMNPRMEDFSLWLSSFTKSAFPIRIQTIEKKEKKRELLPPGKVHELGDPVDPQTSCSLMLPVFPGPVALPQRPLRVGWGSLGKSSQLIINPQWEKP